MKIYSEKTGKEYATVEECIAAEKDFDAKVAIEKAKKEQLNKQRKERANKVEDAYKAMIDAQKNYNQELKNFVKDFGSFHMTFKSGEDNPFNLFEQLFTLF